MNELHPTKTVLITGASTGIGRACALRLDGKGIHVFAGVRSESDAESLQQCASDRLTPVLIDVTDADAIESAKRVIADAVPQEGLAGLVNNAGIFVGGPLEFSSIDEIRKQFEVNLFGVIAVTQAFLPLLRVGGGRIVNMTSVSGLIAFPFLGPYAASKFALEAISDSWRVELRPWSIRVAVVEPGVVDTPILDKIKATMDEARKTFPPEAHDLYGPVFGLADGIQSRGVPADRVAKAVEHALCARRPKHRYLVGSGARIGSIIRKLPVGFRDWLIAKHLPKYGHGDDISSSS